MVAAVDVSPAQDGGILKEITVEGSSDATPAFGSEVTVHYTGTLLDGTQFDSSRGRGEFKFTLGQGQVIKGWDEGVKTMKKGERATFTLASAYAYGEQGSPPKIPANATLVFDIELISWKAEDISEDGDGTLTREVLKKGPESWSKVTDASTATITCQIVDKSGKTLHDYGKLDFEVGEAELHRLPLGVNTAVKKMVRGERCRLSVGGKNDILPEHKKELGIDQSTDFDVLVELLQFEKTQEAWEMNDESKIEQATLAKQKGTERLKSKHFSLAIQHYSRVIALLDHQETKVGTDNYESVAASFHALKLAAHLNLAHVYPMIGENYKAVSAASEAIKLDAKNEKGFFRRAKAQMALNEFELAKNDFKTVVEINSDNKTAAKQIKFCAEKMRKMKDEEKKRYAGKMFG